MKKIAAVALAATMTVGALAPTTGAETEKHPMDSYLISAPLGNKMLDNDTCEITWTGTKTVDEFLAGGSLAPYEKRKSAKTFQQMLLPGYERDLKENQEKYRPQLIRFYTGTTAGLSENEQSDILDALYDIEYLKSHIACAKGENYEASFITQQSSKMKQSERAAAFWTPVALLFAGVLGAVALPTLKPMLPANIAAMLP
ncbi:hypothetical protein [Corynebacterium pseudogenitalium]|uniref:hypothetical protein n=1 Tax=Corynebacterium pseudogenitalium TaxID=38303 RepID=UPI003B9FE7F1